MLNKQLIRKYLKNINSDYRFSYYEWRTVTFQETKRGTCGGQVYTIDYIKLLATRAYS